jgi:serine/threonine protein kinase
LTVCSSTDFRGYDFKALIYEFLPNGNLHEWLHLHPERKGERKVLDLVQRISIAIDVASAIDYLHHHNPFPIIHCDLKPTNVLIDNNMVAQVGDFGLARFLHEDSSDILEQSTSWAAMRGTIGYTAPGLLLFVLWLFPSGIFSLFSFYGFLPEYFPLLVYERY